MEVILSNTALAIGIMIGLCFLGLGIGVGISSGANMLAGVLAKEKIEKEIVTVFADDNKKYLSTDLSKTLDLNPELLSNQIRLLSYEFV